MNENVEKVKKLPLTHSPFLKFLAFFMAIVCLTVGVLGVIGAALMVNYDVYNMPREEFYEELCFGAASTHSGDIAYHVGNDDLEGADSFIGRKNIAAVEIVCTGAQSWSWSRGDWTNAEDSIVYERLWGYYSTEDGRAVPSYEFFDGNTMLVRIRVADSLERYDEYWLSHIVTELAYSMMYAVYFIIVIAAVVFVLSVVYLLNAAGRRRGREGITPAWTTAIPFDLLCAAVFGLGVLSIYLLDALSWNPNVLMVLLMALVLIADAVIALFWLMSCALRFKLGKWWRNTLVFKLLRLIWRGVKVLLRFVGNIRLFWLAGLVFAGIALIELIVIAATGYAVEVEVVLWIIGRLILLAGLVYVLLMLRELRRCGKAVAEGNTNFEANTRYMPRAFREHVEDLRSLSVTVNKAVEQRMVSERMKTELITNVSHDLKTPLTSLINYSHLICREDCNNPHHREYADVLHRQSERMKRLIDDLVEASKASTGNLDVELAPCQMGVIMAQAAGEYEQRLNELGLKLVLSQPEKAMSIMADGRRLWRVMDNLMNNICKYALPGTRVYLSLEEVAGEAVLSFKNTSREMLNLSPEELMERFVRGDASRQSEGSGLGLSIARSLTELQGGRMEIVCDGDLFKVTLKFPVVK